MSDQWIEEAVNLVQNHITAIETQDFAFFTTLFSDKIKDEVLNEKRFKEAIRLFAEHPISVEDLDKEKTEILTENELLLQLKDSERKFCKVIKEKGRWVADSIYWDYTKIDPEYDFESEELIEEITRDEQVVLDEQVASDDQLAQDEDMQEQQSSSGVSAPESSDSEEMLKEKKKLVEEK